MLGKKMPLYRICLLCGIALTLMIHPVVALAEDDRAAILAITDEFFDALKHRDNDRIMALFHDGAYGASLRWDAEGKPILRHGPEAALPAGEDIWTERYWDPTVLVEGNIATIWTPYDFYVNDRFNHCGIDVFSFFKIDDEWKIINTAYTVVQDGSCEMHPDGPPIVE